ncbi:MAG: terminase large subunit domain-containing protein, partial [Betaproteobacteria bacterium]
MSSRDVQNSETVRIAIEYAEAVVSGAIPAGKYHRLACQRQLDNLANAHNRGLRFSVAAAEHIVDFFHDFLKHSKGEWASQPFRLEPWQIFCLTTQYGWIRADGTRRYRYGWNEVPRKNGKSTLSAGK